MVSGSISLPSVGVLFTVPSRYWFAIGRDRYLALGRGRPCFPPDSACPAVLTITDHLSTNAFTYGSLTLSGRPFQQRSARLRCSGEAPAGPSIRLVQPPASNGGSLLRSLGLGSSRFARRYYGNPLCSSGYVRCFSSPGAPLPKGRCPVSPRTGCPIRRSQDHQFPALPLRISPRGRVLHRPVAPRHPPCAHLWIMSAPVPGTASLRGARGDAQRPASHLQAQWVCLFPCQRAAPRRPIPWSRGDSNPGPPPCKGGALPAKLRPLGSARLATRRVGAPGLEPGTSALSGPRSNQLSYAPVGRLRACAQHRVLRQTRSSHDPEGCPPGHRGSWSLAVLHAGCALLPGRERSRIHRTPELGPASAASPAGA